MILHSGAENFFGLAQRGRDLMEPGDVVLVVFDRVERHRQRKVGELRVNAALRGHRHLVIPEAEIVAVLLEVAEEEIVGRAVLFAEAFR